MFRAYAFLQVRGIGSVRITTEPQKTHDDALHLMDLLVEMPGVTGGDTEQEVPGIGWVVTEDAESAVICSRRNNE